MIQQNTEIPDQVVGLFDDDIDSRPIMVTIQCITYNQEQYLGDALEGIVMQKTNFRFEAIVHDDASTDGTAVVLRKYAEKYPEIIRPIYESENQYSKRNGSVNRIMNAAVRGKYIAFCEGDDYWTDPYKLQKQVDFLESHSDCTMCFHNAIEKFEYCDKKSRQFSHIENRYYQGIEFFREWIVPTASVIYRKSVLDSVLYHIYLKAKREGKFIYGDTIAFCICARLGTVRGMSDVMSVYRRNNNGITRQKVDYTLTQRKVTMWKEFARIFQGEYVEVANGYVFENWYSFFQHSLLEERKVCWKALAYSFAASPMRCISSLYITTKVVVASIIAKIKKRR